jgi:hypothetical protein
MEIKIEIDVKPVVKAYLERNFGTPVRLTRDKPTGKFFYKLLEKQENHKDTEYKQYSQKVVVIVGEDCLFRHGSMVTPTSLIDFNNFVTENFYELMYLTIEVQEEMSQDRFRIKEAIQYFLDKFCLTEEILSFETAKKAYYRYRERNNMKISAE